MRQCIKYCRVWMQSYQALRTYATTTESDTPHDRSSLVPNFEDCDLHGSLFWVVTWQLFSLNLAVQREATVAVPRTVRRTKGLSQVRAVALRICSELGSTDVNLWLWACSRGFSCGKYFCTWSSGHKLGGFVALQVHMYLNLGTAVFSWSSGGFTHHSL